MKLFIKNMVCIRCKMVVKSELERIGVPYTVVELGEVELKERISREQRDELDILLKKSGLELMDDKKSMLIERINCNH